MALETKGFDDLFNTLDILGNVGDKVGKNAVKAGAEAGLPYLKKYAPKDSGDGAKKLRITSVTSLVFIVTTIVDITGINPRNK